MSFDYVHHRPEGPIHTLTKTDPHASLTAQQSEGGILRVNLSWTPRPEPASRSRFNRPKGPIDLDLGCLYEHADGTKGSVHALGGTFTDAYGIGQEPLIRLDRDDRHGGIGENLLIDLTKPERIGRILVFAHLYEGVPNWARGDGVVTLYPASGRSLRVRLEDGDRNSPVCAVAMISNDNGIIAIDRKVRYATSHQELDDAFGFGLQWGRERK